MIMVSDSTRDPDIKGVNRELTVEVVTEVGPRVFDAKPHRLRMHQAKRNLQIAEKMLLRCSLPILPILWKT
jgi:hypothetical protein